MPTFSHLYSSALDRELGTDDSTRLFTTGRRKDAINEGLQQFAVLTHCLTRQVSVTLEHGQAQIVLTSTAVSSNADFLSLAPQPEEFRYTDTNGTLTVVSGLDLQRVSVGWLDRNEPGWQNSSATSTGVYQTPRYTFLRTGPDGQQLDLMPPPGRRSTGDSMAMVLYFHALPPTLSADTQVPFLSTTVAAGRGTPVPDLFHYAAVHYGAAQLEKLRRDFEASQQQMQSFLGYVTEWQHQHEPKGMRTVQMGRSYFSDVRNRRGDDYSDIPLGNYS